MISRPQHLTLQVVSDFVCPWCFIGKRSLDQAVTILTARGVNVELEWLPFQLNPDLPADGMDRKAFRTGRFGSWENALAMDGRAVEAGRKVGADFHYERQTRTSSTLAAHRLVRLALVEGGPALQNGVVEALFVAYFTDGQDVGNHAVLAHIAKNAGMSSDAVGRSIYLQDEIRELEAIVRLSGLNGVPSYLLGNNLLFSGSQNVEGYVKSLAAAAGQTV
ncbi:DsbA family oxidoreductase [Bradyrhizobium sp. AUGA SZCCT0176]|uniref:DsbA family oxidoreductase n=1 Tax=unclassified Bradyrhizobium TaxID=2631580 RepID=UPI001BA4B3FF|nr:MULTISPECIES: DsbA family oxidoreductase [unclassified Bradyrhizobium]MBR1225188.1 DsbA family oxidoreductase [Bradyrhizobium sp. AUGA SZCCT0176]MBR1281277.1 DsbA family oxidoreductase [Bradyrhizobium sp. AUGA SZCCT0177]